MKRVVAPFVLMVAGLWTASESLASDALRFHQVEGVDGVPLNVVEVGDPASPGILLVHGIGQSYLSFENQLHSPLQREFHLVAFDLRGHGDSGKPWNREAYVEPAKWAGDVARVMAATGLKLPVLLGWSYGTLVVADYLRFEGSGSLSGIVLIGGMGGLSAPAKPAAGAMAAMLQRTHEEQLSGDLEMNLVAARRITLMLTAKSMPPEWIERTTTIAMMLPGVARQSMMQQSFANQDLVSKITVPLLLFVGAKDQSMQEADARELASKVSGSSVTVFSDAGHSPFVEEPQRFNRELAEFAHRVRRPVVAATPTSRGPTKTHRGED